MEIEIVVVPFDSALRGVRMGAGPEHLIAAGLPQRLERAGHSVRVATVEPAADGWRAEIATAFELAAGIAERVREARAAGRLPLVLAGNCMAAVGAVAGLGAGIAAIWCDAHGDFNTPDTTTGGFLDGMALATLTGRCWTTLAAQVPGFVPVSDSSVWLVGAHDLEPLERAALDRSRVRRLPAEALSAGLAAEAARTIVRGRPLYLHLDLDVLDPSEGRVNGYAVPGGTSARALAAFCGGFPADARPAAVTLSAYDPAMDADGRVRDVALATIEALLAAPAG